MMTLHLPMKKKWYGMIERGEKPEEYREIKPYWVDRLSNVADGTFKPYTHVCFHYGYTKRKMTFEITRMSIWIGNPAWGAPDYEVFIIGLGERIGK